MKAQVLRPPPSKSPNALPLSDSAPVVRRHLAFGWWSLLVFLTAVLALEALHGLKSQAYLGVHQEMRRLMWTLAHAHGTLLSVVNLGFAFMAYIVPQWNARPRDLASGFLRAATLLMPAGFFLGGLFTYSGDPGIGIVLVPVGGILLLISIFLTARALAKR